LLYLLDKEVPSAKKETVTVLIKELDLDQELFLSLLRVKEGTLKPSAKEMELLFKKYLKEIRTLTLFIDAWEDPSQAS
jgi:hypothetical protein